MTHAAIALQRVLYETLISSAELVAELDGSKIYDDVPRGTRPPYIIFGDATYNDWSTGSDAGLEHLLQLNVWAGRKGRKQALKIAEAVETALATVPQELTGHFLVNLRHEFTECGKDDDTGYFVARVNCRAVSEPDTE